MHKKLACIQIKPPFEKLISDGATDDDHCQQLESVVNRKVGKRWGAIYHQLNTTCLTLVVNVLLAVKVRIPKRWLGPLLSYHG